MKTYKTCSGESSNCSNSLGALGYNTGDHSMDIYLTLPASFFERMKKELVSAFEMFKLRFEANMHNLNTEQQ